MKHLGTNQELKTVIVELNEDDLQTLMSCTNAAGLRWGSKGPNFEAAVEEATKTWCELYELSTKIR